MKLKCINGNRARLEKEIVKSIFEGNFNDDSLKRLRSMGKLTLCKSHLAPVEQSTPDRSNEDPA